MGGALIVCYNKPEWLCRLWPGGARSGSIKSIQVQAYCVTPTMLGLVGNEWESAEYEWESAEYEYFSTGWNGGGGL
jgi:hypothetical protein